MLQMSDIKKKITKKYYHHLVDSNCEYDIYRLSWLINNEYETSLSYCGSNPKNIRYVQRLYKPLIRYLSPKSDIRAVTRFCHKTNNLNVYHITPFLYSPKLKTF